MSDVRSFDSIEDMLAFMKENEEAANARIAPAQRTVKAGDYVVLFPSPQEPELLVFGKTYSLEEYVETEKVLAEKYPEDGPFDEEQTRAEYQNRLDRNYLFGKWFSVVEPDGEFGDVHLSTVGGVLQEWIAVQLMSLIKNR